MKVCIVGLGAVGGVIAAGLARLPPGRVQLSALARGATLAAVRERGLQWLPADGGVPQTFPLAVSDDAAALGAQDLVVVAVKGPALAALAPALQVLTGRVNGDMTGGLTGDRADGMTGNMTRNMARNTSGHGRVLQAMNGLPWWFFDALPGPCTGLRLPVLDPGSVLRAAVPTRRVIGAVVHLSATSPAPGVVRHVAGDGLILGHAEGPPDDGVQDVAALLAEAGFAVSVSDRIQREIWFKLWGNMTLNPVSALTGATCDRILDDDLVRAFVSGVMREAQVLGTAIGLPIEQTPEARHAITRKLGAFKTSMLQDLQAGRALEVDALIGAVHDIARHLGRPTPLTDALLGLVRLLAATRQATRQAAD